MRQEIGRTAVSKKRITNMMKEALPECPFCGSKLGYEVTSVIKGHVQCKSCGAEWSSKDFLFFNRISKLRVNELPKGAHSYNVKRYLIRRYENIHCPSGGHYMKLSIYVYELD